MHGKSGRFSISVKKSARMSFSARDYFARQRTESGYFSLSARNNVAGLGRLGRPIYDMKLQVGWKVQLVKDDQLLENHKVAKRRRGRKQEIASPAG